MNFYITLNEEAILEDEIEKIKNALKNQNYTYNVLGNYESRGYLTVVIEVTNLLSQDDAKSVENMVKNNCDTLEVDHYMKFYYILDGVNSSKDINDIVRKKLEELGYKHKLYNSHSENGNLYIGLKVLNINPFNNERIKELTNLINSIEGILNVIKH